MTKVEKVKRSRKAISFLHQAAREYEIAGMHVEVMAMDILIDSRQKKLDYFIAKNFPIVEMTTPKTETGKD